MNVKEEELWSKVLKAHGKLEEARNLRRRVEINRGGYGAQQIAGSAVWKAERDFRKHESAWKAEAYAKKVREVDAIDFQLS